MRTTNQGQPSLASLVLLINIEEHFTQRQENGSRGCVVLFGCITMVQMGWKPLRRLFGTKFKMIKNQVEDVIESCYLNQNFFLLNCFGKGCFIQS